MRSIQIEEREIPAKKDHFVRVTVEYNSPGRCYYLRLRKIEKMRSRETGEYDGCIRYALFDSTKEIVLEQAGRFNRKRLEQLASGVKELVPNYEELLKELIDVCRQN